MVNVEKDGDDPPTVVERRLTSCSVDWIKAERSVGSPVLMFVTYLKSGNRIASAVGEDAGDRACGAAATD